MRSKKLLATILAVIPECALLGMPAAASGETSKHEVEEVVVVFKTHFDIGFTDLASSVVKRYQTSMIDKALDVVDQNRNLPPDRQFVWTLPGWPMSKMLEDWPGQTKERHDRIVSAVRAGRLVWHALPYTTHTESLELEDLVRGMNFSSALSRQFGQPLARDAKMTDVPSHCWVLPTLLKSAGVEFLHLGCNAASSSPQLPPLFWWEGPDGSRVLTMYSGGDYGTWGYNMMVLPVRYGKAWEEELAKGTYAKLERSFAEKGQYVRDAEAAVEPALYEDMSMLAKAVKADGDRFVVFNPLPWKRSHGPVCVDAGKVRAAALRDVETGRVLPVEQDGSRIRFLANDMPSQGYRTYVPVAEGTPPTGMLAVDPAGKSIENDVLKILLDPARGGVVSIIDKSTGRELVDSSKYVAGQYLHERFDRDDDEAYLAAYCKIRPDWAATFGKPKLPPVSQTKYRAESPVNMKAVVRQGAVSATVTMTAQASPGPAPAVTLQFTLYRGDVSYIDMQWAVNGKQADPWPEAGWICLPFKVDQPQFRLGRVGSIMDPSKDIVRGANHDIFCVSSGLTVSGPGGEGVGVVPLDSPLVSLGRPGLYRYDKEWKDREPNIFINLFNNIWGTNFQQWIGGSWSSRVRIWALPPGGSAAVDLIARGWEARTPCLSGFADGTAGKLPPTARGIELSRDGILITAFGANPDGKGVILRLWEQAGISGKVTVRLPPGMKASSITPVNLRGESMGKSEPVGLDRFEVDLQAFAPVSYVLE